MTLVQFVSELPPNLEQFANFVRMGNPVIGMNVILDKHAKNGRVPGVDTDPWPKERSDSNPRTQTHHLWGPKMCCWAEPLTDTP
jgi:hypothetical protein